MLIAECINTIVPVFYVTPIEHYLLCLFLSRPPT